jgi:hypothetical protein
VNQAAAATPPARRRRWLRWLLIACIAVFVVTLITLRIVLQPERATRLILSSLGNALGLEITAHGRPELQLRGTPTLVVRDVTATQPGAHTPLLRAERILLSLPWSTIRNRGSDLDLVRIELDAPVLDLPALQRWLATRPPSSEQTKLPVLRKGLAIVRGRIDNAGWRIDGIDLSLRELHPDKPLSAKLRGRYVVTATAALRTAIPFDLALAMTRPRNGAGTAVVGSVALERGDWQLPMSIKLSGPLRLGRDSLHMMPARLAMSAVYVAGDTRLPFVLGVHGPLRFDEATWTLAPAGIALRGNGVVPAFDARGAFALGRALALRLQGRLPQWPEAWPALPPPIGASQSPLPFVLDYAGAVDFSGITRLRLQRDAASFDARMRLPEVLAWIDADTTGTPLPPLSGTVSAPRLEISGAQLEGVEVVIDEPGIPAAEAQ